jgi:hypothetical protein
MDRFIFPPPWGEGGYIFIVDPLDKVKHKCKIGSKELQKKSTMVEDAIEDLIALALEFKNCSGAGPNGDMPDSESGSSVKVQEPYFIVKFVLHYCF